MPFAPIGVNGNWFPRVSQKGMRRMYQYKKKLIAVLTAVSCVLGTGANSEASLVQAKDTTGSGVVIAESLNVRAGAGVTFSQVKVNGKVVYLHKSDPVQILDEQNGFYKIQFYISGKKVSGYSSKAFIQASSDTSANKGKGTSKKNSTTDKKDEELLENDLPGAAATSQSQVTVSGINVPAKIVASALRVRSKASTTSKQVMVDKKPVSLVKGTSVSIRKQKIVKGNVWYYIRVKYEGKIVRGYVVSDYVQLKCTKPIAGKITTDSKLVVRNTPGVSDDYVMHNKTIVKLANNKKVKIKGEAVANCKKWLKISFTYKNKTREGYVLANRVLFYAEPTQVAENTEGTPSTDTTIENTTSVPNISSGGAVTGSAQNSVPAVVRSSVPLNVRVEAGTDKEKLIYHDIAVQLLDGKAITILDTKIFDGAIWYYVSFAYEDTILHGFVLGNYVDINSAG